jgi:hypothetical protein
MSVTTGTECVISGDWNICPADTKFTQAGVSKTLEADIKCPFDSVQQSSFLDASQKGLCECDARLIITDDPDPNAVPEDMVCECYACPTGSRQGFSYECTKPIYLTCLSFNCAGDCNGDLNLGLDDSTFPPTAAPTEPSAAHGMSTSMPIVILVLAIVRMIR